MRIIQEVTTNVPGDVLSKFLPSKLPEEMLLLPSVTTSEKKNISPPTPASLPSLKSLNQFFSQTMTPQEEKPSHAACPPKLKDLTPSKYLLISNPSLPPRAPPPLALAAGYSKLKKITSQKNSLPQKTSSSQ